MSADDQPKERRWQLALTSAEVLIVHDALALWMDGDLNAPRKTIMDLRARLAKMGDVQ